MKALLFCSNFPKTYDEAFVSGVVKNAVNQAVSLAKTGVHVTVITDGPHKGEWNFEGVEVHGVGKGRLKGIFKAAYLDVKITWRLLQIGYKKFDVVHIHTGNLVLYFLLRAVRIIKHPVIYTAHGTTTPELEANVSNKNSISDFLVTVNGWVQERIDKFMWKRSSVLISVSKYQEQEMKSIYRVPPNKIVQIYNGVDESRYYPDSKAGLQMKQRLGISQSEKIVLFVGRLARKKGVDVLLQAGEKILQKSSNVRFVFVLGELGRGADADYVQEVYDWYRKSQFHSHIFLCENVVESDLPQYYQMADVCVFPSKEYESLPTVIYEAMACGVPIITPNAWGTPEVLSEVLIKESEVSIESLQASISHLLYNESECARISAQYKGDIAAYHWSAIATEYKNLYEQFSFTK